MTTPVDIKNIAPGSLVIFMGEPKHVALVLERISSVGFVGNATGYVVLWGSGRVRQILFWPDEAGHVTIIPPNPDTED